MYCKTPHSRVYCAALKAKIFLTITDMLKIVDYTGLSMRLPPRAAKQNQYAIFHCWKKKKAAFQTAI